MYFDTILKAFDSEANPHPLFPNAIGLKRHHTRFMEISDVGMASKVLMENELNGTGAYYCIYTRNRVTDYYDLFLVTCDGRYVDPDVIPTIPSTLPADETVLEKLAVVKIDAPIPLYESLVPKCNPKYEPKEEPDNDVS
jgi:hypothetical protein